MIVENDLLGKSFKKPSRPSSLVGLPRIRSRSQNDAKDVSSLVFRVILIGSKRVGKSSIIHRYLKGTFSDAYRPTVSDIYEKTVMRSEGDVLNMFKIYDTAGDLQYEFPAMFGLTVAEGDMFALIYSVENRKSFEIIKTVWQNIVDLRDREKDIPFVLVANKADVSATRRKVSETEGHELSKEIDCPYVEVSAKTGLHIDSIYRHLLEEKDIIGQRDNDQNGVKDYGRCTNGTKQRSPMSNLKLADIPKRPGMKSKQSSCVVM